MDHPTISSFHFCPSCGQSSIKKENNKKLHCQKCDFQLYLNPATAVSLVLYNEKNEILLATRAKNPGVNMLDLPGGFVDPFETAEDAARREIQEELNIQLDQLNYLGTETNVYPYKQVTYQTVDIGFSSFVSSETIFKIDPELKSVAWAPYSKIEKEKIAFHSAYLLIQNFVQKLNR